MATTPRRRWFRLGSRIAIALFSAALALIGSEVLLRAYLHSKGVGRGDFGALLEQSGKSTERSLHGGTGLFGLLQPSTYPDAVYELRPNQAGLFVDARVEINAHGMRGRELSIEKPAGTYRIAGIGDSHMFGWGVEQGQTYLERLEHKLNEAAPPERRFEVLNFAAPGYNTAMEVAIFEHKALRFDPDLVILHFIGNDMQAPHFLDSVRGWAPGDWYLAELARILANRPESEDEESEAIARRYRSDDYRRLRGTPRFRQAMQRLHDLCRERNIPVIYLVLGSQGKHRALVLSLGDQLGFHVLEPSATFLSYLERHGHPATPESWEKVFEGRDAHPNAAGHAAYAEALFARLTALGVIEASTEPAPAASPGTPPSENGDRNE